MKKRTNRIILAAFLAVICLFCSAFVMRAATSDGLVITATAAKADVKITKQPKSVAVAKNKTASVKVVASGKNLTYKWYYKDACASKFKASSVKTATYSVKMDSSRDGRQVYCVVTDKSGNSVKTKTVTLTMQKPAKITTQPKNVAAFSGKTASVKVKATGDGLTYKWYYKDAGGSKFKTSSVNTSTYSVEMSKGRNGRQVYCVITDKYGNSVKTKTVTLTMKNPAKIATQPKNVAALSGKTASVKVKATGDGLTYKWYYKDAGGSKFKTSSVKTATYSVEMSKSRNGRQVYCVITDKYGNSVKTKTVTLTMKNPAKITTQPKNVAAFSGKTASVKVKATGDGLTYKWYYKDAGGSKFKTSSVNTSTYSVEMSKSRNGRQVYCVITDKYGNSVKTKTVTLTMATELKITLQPTTVVAKSGSAIKFTVGATGDGLTYKWYYKDAGDTKFKASSVSTATYSTEISKSRDGRQVYCVITDKYGSSVQSAVAAMHMGTPVAITQQPLPVTALNKGDVNIRFTAVGEGLTYTWYYKEKGASKFSVTKTFTSNYYSTTMNDSRNGRQVYCVVTDKYGYSVTTNVVTMHLGSPITISMQPSSVTVDIGKNAVVMVGASGEGLTYQWYYKNPGSSNFVLTTSFTGPSYSVEMSDSRDGRQIYCVITDKNGAQVQTDTVTLSATPYIITVVPGIGDPYDVNVKKGSTYSLATPSRPGYSFKGWKTAAGKDFAANGTVDKDVTVYATWEITGTDTLAKLIACANSGAPEILITGNITINQPIYISYNTKIYTNGNYTLKRDPNYAGDLFVVGKDANGVTSLLHHRDAILTLGGGQGTLTIDGNKANTKVDVVGSLIFAGDSSTVNIYDGVRLCNNNKVGNDRMLTYNASASETTITRAGGAAIINQNSSVFMYGGVIDNNSVKTEHTITINAEGAEVKNETAGCGGAIYNYGEFRMYGGVIKENEALRGGAVYIIYPAYFESGTIQGNKSHTYGGAISTSAGSYANLYIGSEGNGATMLIKDNYSVSAGGALYSNTVAPIIILGNTVFEGNSSDYSGGAIYTGGTLTVRNTTFRGNTCVYSGGAVFFHNTKDSTWEVREAEITGCTFEENKASLGGAITFSRSNAADPNATGVIARVSDCHFYRNEAIKNEKNPGNGGAIYVTQLADATITGCEFSENIAANSGGAVGIHGEATAKLTDLTFTKNTAVSGGALYLSVNTTDTLKNLTFTENKSILSESGSGGNGGAIFMTQAKVTAENLDIRNNTAATHAGAIYMQATTLTLGDDTKIESNSAGDHGGAFYLTYITNEDSTKTGSHLILNEVELKGHTAKTGGAISIRTDCQATLNGAKLVENTATSPVDEVMGGGAIYVGFGKLAMTDTLLDKNTSAYYGGAISSRKSEVSITGGTVSGSTGATGAALYFREGSNVTMKDVSVTGNTASANGVLYINGGSLDMDNVTASGNKASNGGVLFTSGASTNVTLNNSTWSENNANNGGAINMTNATVTIANTTFSDNTARLGGAIYNSQGVLTTENVSFTNNSAIKSASGSGGNGGAVTLTGGQYTVSATDSFTENTAENHAGAIYVSYIENETTKERIGGVLTANGASFIGNTAMGGGAVSIRTDGEATFDGTVFIDNKVVGNDGKADGYGEGGGAIYVGYGKLTMTNVIATGNTAETTGGAIHLLDSDATITGSNFTENSGKNGGAIYAMAGGNSVISGSNFTENTATGNGGAIYLAEGATVALTELEFTRNQAANGGAIFNANADITANSLDMQGNTATGNGGAIYLQGKELNLDADDVFNSNSAGGHGGAIYLVYKTNADNSRTGAVLNATGTTFEGNTAMAGGAISARSACAVNLDGVTLTGNSVSGFQNNGDEDPSDDNDGDSEGGGAIYVGYGSVTLNNVTATANTASDFGGVVSAVSSPVTITGGTYSSNATNNGGVVHAMGNSTVTANGATFTGNASLYEGDTNSDIGGGVFHTIGGSLHITGCTLDGNSSTYYGGVIHANKTAVTIDGETEIKNTTGATGAALHMRSAKVILENVSITDNASSMNGVIYYTGSDLTLDNVTASGNTAYQGGVLFVNSATATIKNSAFSGNSATNGGVIYSKGKTTMTIENCEMSENTASYGGAIYTIDNGTFNLTGNTFLKNSATKDGGVIYNKGGVVNAADTETAQNVFTENTAGSHGGAIYVVYLTDETTQEKTGGVLNMTGGNFTGNTAMGGGAVSARTDCEATFDGTTFTGNKVAGNDGTADGYGEGGGAVYVGYGKLTMTNVTATGNTSENHSGAVHLLDSDATITGSTFDGNKAADGGAILAKAGGTLVITESTFTNNSATNSGGAIYAAAPVTGELKNLVFTGNHADGNGGALFLSEAEFTTEKLNMQNNSAGNNGGAAYINAITITVTENDVFKGNSADGHGGAFYLVYNSNNVGATLIGNNAVFENNTAKAGGAISSRSYCTVNLTGGSLKNNASTAPQPDGLGGGAIYTNNGTLTLSGVTLDGNTTAYYGAAVYSTGSVFTATDNCVVKNNVGITGAALWLSISEGQTATITDMTLTDNTRSTGTANGTIYAKGSGNLNITNLTASGNVSSYGGILFTSGSLTISLADSTITGNQALTAGGVVAYRGNKTMTITGCTITGNTATNGGVIEASGTGTLDITNSTVTNNSAANGGAIYCENGVVNVIDCQMSENTATTSGGAISVAKTGTVNVLEGTTLTTNSAPIGGAVYLDLGGTANINGATLTGNTATGSGGAIAATDSSKEEEEPAPATLTITDATLANNSAKYGGAVYLDKAATATVTGSTMSENTATLGGAVYNLQATVTLDGAEFTKNHAASNGGAILVNAGSVTGTADFDQNSAVGHAGAIYLTYTKGTDGAPNIPGIANLTGGAFTNNTAMGGGAVSIRTSCIGTFENVTFSGNSVSGFQDDGKTETENDNDGDGEGGGAIYVGYGSVTLNNVTATDNTSTDSFGGFLDCVQSTVNISGGTYTGNSAPAGGVIYSPYKADITITDATISENEATFVNPDASGTYHYNMGGGAISANSGTIAISGTTLDGNVSSYYGGAIIAGGTTLTINDGSVISNSTGKTGSAIYIRSNAKVTIEDSSITDNKEAGSGVIYISQGTLNLNDVTATGNTANTGGVVVASGSGATVNVTGGTYSLNSAKYGGVIYAAKEAKVNVSGATFTQNTSNLGGAIYSTSSTMTLTGSSFTKNTSTKEASGSNGNGGALVLVGGTLTATGNNVFTENTAENHGGAIYVSYVTKKETVDGNSVDVKVGGMLNMTDGTFESNSAACGGAISARTACSVTLTGTTLKTNSATATGSGNGGGAIYTNDGSLTLSGVTLDGNTTGYYGAAVYATGSVFTATDNCVVKNNKGVTGSALWLSIGANQTATITDMTLTNNTRSSGTGNGTIYATGSGTLNMTNLTASENVSSNGGVLYTSGGLTITLANSTITDNEALGVGGVVAYRGSKTMTITGCTFSGNTAPNGGVIEASGAGTVTINSSTVQSNSATASGGAIYATGTGKVVVSSDTVLKTNSAKNGGAVAVDLGGTVTINGSTLDGNSSTAEGGAVYVADSTKEGDAQASKLYMNNALLQNNTAGTRGGALATDTASTALIIEVTGCTFYKNSAPTSGGAVCIQNSNCNSATDPTSVTIVFTNCTFRENSTTYDGGAIDLRTGSCMKIDGITADSNTADRNGAVVYVTSNNSRLYITGEVVCKDNMATKAANFAYLYNNDYPNPPKIYTTHSNTAEWSTYIKGNKTNIVFDLTSLP